MPNLPQEQTIIQYLANNAQTEYTFAFYAPEQTDIQVFLQAPNATPVPAADILELSTDYTVTYNADPTTGGYITLLVAPTTGWYLTINLQVEASLNTNFANAQTINGANLDAAFDRLLLLCMQNQNYALNRNLSYVINDYLPNNNSTLPQPATQLPPLPQNYIWVGSSSGIVAAQLAQVPSASVLQSLLANNSPGTDGARLVGYYDVVNSNPTTVQNFLANVWASPVITTPTLNQPIINQGTINQPNIVGVTTNSNAAAGSVGELISSVVASSAAVSLTTSTPNNVTMISLTAGDWDVEGGVSFAFGGSATGAACWISKTSALTPFTPDYSLYTAITNAGGIGSTGIVPQKVRISVSVTTTVYLSASATFSTSTATACGGIYARRVR